MAALSCVVTSQRRNGRPIQRGSLGKLYIDNSKESKTVSKLRHMCVTERTSALQTQTKPLTSVAKWREREAAGHEYMTACGTTDQFHALRVTSKAAIPLRA